MVAADIIRRPSDTSNKSDFVGFANFPNQVFRRCIKNGFDFTIMVVGQSGLGKSTFLNSLFLADIYDTTPKEKPIPKTVEIKSQTLCMMENDVKLYATFVDTPGFGDHVNNANCWDPIVKYIDSKFGDYLSAETMIERNANIRDNRVHLCFYFIAPTGHGLKELDIEFMKALQEKVNIIPVIAKADTLTTSEMVSFKQNILRELEEHEIRVYKFPEQDNLVIDIKNPPPKCEDTRKRIPFAVVGSNKVVDVGSKRVRVREYPWGTVEVENLVHNDFIALRDMIIRSNLIDLVNVTRDVHYENFRYKQMCKGNKGGALDRDPFTQLEQEKLTCEREAEEVRRTKEKIFADKVAAREAKMNERARQLDEQEKENRRILEEKHRSLQLLIEQSGELRRAAGINDSGSSIGRHSPPEKSKKKSGTLNIFNRN
uniref:Septin n=1 Tax=Panagrellus redivivus TaxID=6233 RepID=A0A7E4VG78_PANRE